MSRGSENSASRKRGGQAQESCRILPNVFQQAGHQWEIAADTAISPMEQLVSLLTHRGILPDHIPGLVRNVLGVIREGGLFTTYSVNKQLEQLGWGCEPLDETSFQLIVHILETEWGYRVRHYRVG